MTSIAASGVAGSRVTAVVVCIGLMCAAGCDRKDKGAAAQAGVPAALASNPLDAGRDAVVVTVDGAKLTQAEVDDKVARMLAAEPGAAELPPETLGKAKAQMSKEIIDSFVVQTLLLKEADRRNVVVDDKDVQGAVSNITAKLPEGVSIGKELARFGMTETEFRKQLTQDLKVRKLVNLQADSIPPATDKEIVDFYTAQQAQFEVPESIHARHVLILCDTNADVTVRAEKKSRADALRVLLLKGTNFEEVAKQNSDCPSKERGGDLGTLTRGQTVKEFEDAAFSQKVNEIGPVVQSSFGYHIIQVLAHNPATNRPLAEVKADIAAYLGNSKKQEAVTQFVDDLKSKAQIKYTE